MPLDTDIRLIATQKTTYEWPAKKIKLKNIQEMKVQVEE
jgi:hypothetical protein